MGGWGCPHEARGQCQKVLGKVCEPGMKGCVLAGRFIFSNPEKNTARALREKGDRWQQDYGEPRVRKHPRDGSR